MSGPIRRWWLSLTPMAQAYLVVTYYAVCLAILLYI